MDKCIYRKDLWHKIGNVLFFFLILVIMLDPTNTILHAKDFTFITLVTFCIIAFKPDWSKLPYILMPLCAVAIPYIFTAMKTQIVDDNEVLAVFKSISPLVLLLWIREFNLMNLAKFPVIICCLITDILFVSIMLIPEIETPIYLFFTNKDDTIIMAHRWFLGVLFYCMYIKSCVSFILIFTYYIYNNLNKATRNLKGLVYLIIILFTFCISGTRSTMLTPIFLFCIIAYLLFKDAPKAKHLIYPIIVIIGITFIIILIALATDTSEASNVVKYGHISSYLQLFEEHPGYLLIGEGPGTSFYSEGFNNIVLKTEWTYLELLRCYGLFSIIIVGVFCKPLFTIWKYRKDKFTLSVFWAYLAYLLIAGTNPLLISSTGMIMLLMTYSYEAEIKRNANTPLK